MPHRSGRCSGNDLIALQTPRSPSSLTREAGDGVSISLQTPRSPSSLTREAGDGVSISLQTPRSPSSLTGGRGRHLPPSRSEAARRPLHPPSHPHPTADFSLRERIRAASEGKPRRRTARWVGRRGASRPGALKEGARRGDSRTRPVSRPPESRPSPVPSDPPSAGRSPAGRPRDAPDRAPPKDHQPWSGALKRTLLHFTTTRPKCTPV